MVAGSLGAPRLVEASPSLCHHPPLEFPLCIGAQMSPFDEAILHWEPTLLQDKLVITNDICNGALHKQGQILRFWGRGTQFSLSVPREGQDLAHTFGLFPYLQLYFLATNSRPRTQLPCPRGCPKVNPRHPLPCLVLSQNAAAQPAVLPSPRHTALLVCCPPPVQSHPFWQNPLP